MPTLIDALAFCHKNYKQGGKFVGYNQWSKTLTETKKTEEKGWLSEVASIPLQQSLKDLQTSFKNFFDSHKGKRKGKKVRPPRFKKRKSKQSARFTQNGFKINRHTVYLTKIGNLKIVWSRELPSKPSSVTVIKDSADRYFVSFVIEVKPLPKPKTNKSVGIDLGITTFATLSNGKKINAPKPLKRYIQRLRRLSKNLSKKQRGSKRYERSRIKKAKLQAKLKDIRTDFLHKLSTQIINDKTPPLRARFKM